MDHGDLPKANARRDRRHHDELVNPAEHTADQSVGFFFTCSLLPGLRLHATVLIVNSVSIPESERTVEITEDKAEG